jgi:hypothetical protein
VTTIARRIIAEPIRTASETWMIIVDLLAPEADNEAREELLAVIGVASSLIAEEVAKDVPIVVYGSGPRVHIYCLYGENAIEGGDKNESQFTTSPVKGDWAMSLPCLDDELEWVQAALKKRSSRITARELNAPERDNDEKGTNEKSTNINLEAFLRS